MGFLPSGGDVAIGGGSRRRASDSSRGAKRTTTAGGSGGSVTTLGDSVATERTDAETPRSSDGSCTSDASSQRSSIRPRSPYPMPPYPEPKTLYCPVNTDDYVDEADDDGNDNDVGEALEAVAPGYKTQRLRKLGAILPGREGGKPSPCDVSLVSSHDDDDSNEGDYSVEEDDPMADLYYDDRLPHGLPHGAGRVGASLSVSGLSFDGGGSCKTCSKTNVSYESEGSGSSKSRSKTNASYQRGKSSKSRSNTNALYKIGGSSKFWSKARMPYRKTASMPDVESASVPACNDGWTSGISIARSSSLTSGLATGRAVADDVELAENMALLDGLHSGNDALRHRLSLALSAAATLGERAEGLLRRHDDLLSECDEELSVLKDDLESSRTRFTRALGEENDVLRLVMTEGEADDGDVGECTGPELVELLLEKEEERERTFTCGIDDRLGIDFEEGKFDEEHEREACNLVLHLEIEFLRRALEEWDARDGLEEGKDDRRDLVNPVEAEEMVPGRYHL